MPSRSHRVERARPLLGTLVTLRVAGLSEGHAHAAIDSAFARIAHLQARMSFQSDESDVARLNRALPGQRIRVDPETYAVLAQVQILARASRGVFDPTVAAELVRAGRLPEPAGARPPDPRARWSDVVLEGGEDVVLRRPVWLDLSGIAKGHAVDRAVSMLSAAGATEVCADAGGDLRIDGGSLTVPLRTGYEDEAQPVLRLEDGSLASSGGHSDPRHAADGQHRDGVGRHATEWGRFACVVASRCAVADALTKVVLALGAGSTGVLSHFGATAYLREPGGTWNRFGSATGA